MGGPGCGYTFLGGTEDAGKYLQFGSLKWHFLHSDNTIQQDLIVLNRVVNGTLFLRKILFKSDFVILHFILLLSFFKKDFVQIRIFRAN